MDLHALRPRAAAGAVADAGVGPAVGQTGWQAEADVRDVAGGGTEGVVVGGDGGQKVGGVLDWQLAQCVVLQHHLGTRKSRWRLGTTSPNFSMLRSLM